MKITTLKIRNLFGIKEFDSTGKSIELSGKNGVGKSAVIDSIIYALTNKSDRPDIIMTGENEGEVLIEMDNGLRIHRKPRTNKADYKSIKQSGEPAEKTESFLREIFTPLQLNPVEFAEMDTNEQNRIILDLIDFKWDLNWIKEQFGEIPPDVNYEQNILRVLHDIQAEEGFYFLKRQELNREARNKNAFIHEIGSSLPNNYDSKKWESVNLGEIYKKIETIRNANEWIERAKNAVKGKDGKLRQFQADLEIEENTIDRETTFARNSLEKDIQALEAKIKANRATLANLEEKKADKIALAKQIYETNVAELEGELSQYTELAKKEPTQFIELQEQVNESEKMKLHINEFNRMMDLKQEVLQLEDDSKSLTAKIEKARMLPGEILANSNIPIAGLTIKDGFPLINERPVSNLSEGEKLELCVSVTVAKEGNLKMILIDGVERLSSEKRTSVYSMLKEKGVQFIATRTTDDENLTVIEL